MTASEVMAEFTTELSFDDIPEGVIDITKKCVLDILGCALAGFVEEEPQQIIATIKNLDKNPDSTIWGDGTKVSSPLAAFANAASSEGNDFSYSPVIGFGTTTIPVSISLGEKMRINGEELISSIVAAHEVMWRVLLATDSVTIYNRGFYNTGIMGPIGAVTAAGKVLNLNKEQMVSALGLAGTSGTGTFAFLPEGLRTKLLYHGRAAETGVLSAYLARQGFKGPKKVFEGEKGFLKLYSDPKYDIPELTHRLGEEFLTKFVVFKMYPACRAAHSSIDAAITAMKEYNISAEDVDEITIRVSERDETLVGSWRKITDMLSAQFSIPWLVASTLVERHGPTLDSYSEERILHPKILRLAERVKVLGDPELSRIRHYEALPPLVHPSRMKLTTKDGRKIEISVDQFKGSTENPPADEDILEKFRIQVKRVFPDEKIDRLCSIVKNLEKIADIRELTKLLYV